MKDIYGCRQKFIGAVNGSCANFIKNNEVGYACNAEDSEALAGLILGLNENNLKNIVKNSKVVYFKNIQKKSL